MILCDTRPPVVAFNAPDRDDARCTAFLPEGCLPKLGPWSAAEAQPAASHYYDHFAAGHCAYDLPPGGLAEPDLLLLFRPCARAAPGATAGPCQAHSPLVRRAG
jgi:hypothetical protein